MFAKLRKIFLSGLLALVILTTGAWQRNPVVRAESLITNTPETPLYPGLTWSGPLSSTRNIRINLQGDTISLPGMAYKAAEQLTLSLHTDVLNYYSNAELAKSGWTSYDALEAADGVHYVFEHAGGVYLSVEYLKCAENPSYTCITVWESAPVTSTTTTQAVTNTTPSVTTATFGKTSPANDATGLNPTNTVLDWEAYSPTPEKYSYCVKAGSQCDNGDPNWTSVYSSTSVKLTSLNYDTTYYWQVRAVTCGTCVPKTFVYADNGTWWTFKTTTAPGATIVGNAGIGGAKLTYTDSTVKTVTADGTGAYSITVPLHWSGTVTPSKAGYLFSPKSASFTDLTAAQTIQNFTAVVAYTISGNVGIAGVTLSYTDGTPQTVMSDSGGNYIIIIPSGWSGTVTPSKTGYVFSPASRNYSNVTANQTAQNYTAQVVISGSTGIAGVTLRYTDVTLKTVTADGSGNYSFIVPMGWTGIVTPYKTGYTFTPVNRSYSNVQTGQSAQNYTAQACASCADVNVSIGGTAVGAYTVPVSGSARDTYPVDSGPVKVNSTNAVNIIAALRDAWLVNGQVRSFAQLMGLPKEQLSDTYYFPAYNNLTLSGQLRIANVDTTATDVTVTIAGVNRGTYHLNPNESVRPTYALDAGPVEVKSSGGTKIIAALRDAWLVNGQVASFVQLMGLPKESLSDTYYFPAYNNVTLSGQLRIANVDTVATDVTVTVAGVVQNTYHLNPNESVRPVYSLDAGPVMVQSAGGTKIIAALRDAWLENGQVQSFAELMGLPKEKLSDTYLFPAYNNVTLSGQLRIANVDTVATDVTVTIAGVQRGTYHLNPNESVRPVYNLDAGPVVVKSAGGTKIIAALRDAWLMNGQVTSFVQLMGLPKELLSTTYYFPAYNNLTLSDQLRFAVP